MYLQQSIIAHRGASAHAPENTMAAFELAHRMRCGMIECDVMLSADGIPFIFHDESLDRTTNGTGYVHTSLSDFLRQLDAGAWFSKHYQGQKIVTLDEVLQWLVKTGMQANIEIKPHKQNVERTTITVLERIASFWPADRPYPLISSFDLDVIRICQQRAAQFPRALLLHRWNRDWLRLARELACFSIHLNRFIVSRSRIEAIKAHGYHVLVYTINHKWLANKLFAWGVDGIFSDNLLEKSM